MAVVGTGEEEWWCGSDSVYTKESVLGTRSGMPERSLVGRCQCWQRLPDVIDRVGNQGSCVRSGQWRQDQRSGAGGDDNGSRARCSEVDALCITSGTEE